MLFAFCVRGASIGTVSAKNIYMQVPKIMCDMLLSFFHAAMFYIRCAVVSFVLLIGYSNVNRICFKIT